MILVVPATRGARLFTEEDDEEIMTVLSCTEGKVFLRPEVIRRRCEKDDYHSKYWSARDPTKPHK